MLLNELGVSVRVFKRKKALTLPLNPRVGRPSDAFFD
jgi:hypothetical protein